MPETTEFLFSPNIRLYGSIEPATVTHFLDQLAPLRAGREPIVLELTTEGGDAEAARRIALEIRLCRQWHKRETYFVGKTNVLSAGMTIMAAFPRNRRFVTADTVLLVHERRIQRTINLNGPIRADMQMLREALAELESAQRLEQEGFADLAADSRLSTEELYRRAADNFYLSAQEAAALGLVAGII